MEMLRQRYQTQQCLKIYCRKYPVGETKVLNGETSSVDYECGQFLLDIPIAHGGQVKCKPVA